ncbi:MULTISPECIES: LuxR family transcriptional regulator [unclassified Streptomyces]|uniref:helix-turn-helix transcriptional regulator n=1 Tax=unclassified Streptomyces TaxID=2593676 RepID=UPI00225A8B2C|nr:MULTISPECIES: AAA family ATPase [unclassified Streptomyces]MCX4524090.1 AAA family ATPase [Streptomyces sp. NBC_01551]MCX4545392.1 AAA family ATPase [Streptomyces sp. NBC_01565]
MARLVEREKQWETLNDLLGSARRGRGRVAVISGPIAAGKTTLLERFTEQAISDGALVLEAAGSRAERYLPFGILRRILDSAAPLEPEVHAEATALLDSLGTPTTDTHEPATGAIAGGVEAGMRILPYVCAALLRIARERTVVIAVDDVHHGDELSRAFLLCLARRVRQAGVLIVLTEAVRLLPAQLAFHAELQRQPNCTSIRLPLLSADGTGRVLAGHFSTAAAQRVCADCQETTGGNPLLIKALLEDGLAALGDSEPFQPLAPAENFERAVLDCLHRGDPEMLAVARGIAVLGDACPTALLSTITDVHVKTAELAVQDLDRCGILRGGAFREAATRAAVLAATPTGALSVLHQRAARLLHQEGAAALDVARHLLAARKQVGEWAIPVLQEAAEYALVEDDPELALRCGELAVDSCPEGPRRTALKSRLVSIVWRSSPVAAEGHLRQLSREFCAGRLSDRDLLHAVTCLAWMGEARQAGEAVRRLQTAAQEALDAGQPFVYEPGTLAAAQSWLSLVSPPVREVFATAGPSHTSHTSRPGDPRTPAGTAAAGATAYDMPDEAHIPAVEAMRTALRGGQGEAAVAEATRVLQRYHLSDRTLTPLVIAALTLVYAGRLDLALIWTDRLLGECSARNAPTWQAALGVVRAEVALRQGDLPGAAAQARQAMSLISVQCWGVGIALPLAILIDAETRMGNLDEAMGLLEQPVPEMMLETQIGLHYLRARGRCHLATGRYHAALRDFLTCGELMQAWGMDAVELAPWRLDAAEAWLAIGNMARAREYVEQQKQREAGPAGSRPRGALLYALARTSGDLTYRLGRLTEAVEALEQGEDRLQLASALGELGSGYRAAGDFNRARMLVRKAWHVAKSCGAQPLCQEFTPGQGDGEAVAAPAGREAEPAREAESLSESLSEAEARVALLAARGHTNREIATKLYVTVSTVEQHLTRIYRKLRVKRRRDLPARLWDLSLPGIA